MVSLRAILGQVESLQMFSWQVDEVVLSLAYRGDLYSPHRAKMKTSYTRRKKDGTIPGHTAIGSLGNGIACKKLKK